MNSTVTMFTKEISTNKVKNMDSVAIFGGILKPNIQENF